MSAGSQIDQLLDTLNLSQLRDLALSLARPSDTTKNLPTNREKLLETIHRSADTKKIGAVAQRIEAIAPYKHLFLFAMPKTGKGSGNFDAVAKLVNAAFPNLSQGVANVKPQPWELTPQLGIIDSRTQRIYLKFIHEIQTWQWERVSPTEKRMRQFRRRHPVVLTLRPAQQLATIAFPGYTQGADSPTKERKTYSDIAKLARELLYQKTQIELGHFNLKAAIESALLREKDVIDIRRAISGPLGGKLTFYSGEQMPDLVKYVVNYFKEHANITLSEANVRTLFKSSEALDILLFWRKEDLLTRAAFHEVGPELLFIWRGTPSDTSRIDVILRTLVENERLSSVPDIAKARELVEKSKAGDVIRPSWLAQQFNLSTDQSMAILHEGLSRGLLIFVFRVKTDAVLQLFQNVWRKNLEEFPKSVIDEHGNVIDLSSSAQIEVAFERIAK
jgi:hypothetical protein